MSNFWHLYPNLWYKKEAKQTKFMLKQYMDGPLGKYDSVVQKCIRELVASGEKPTSFLVVATAKQVLTEHEPQLLETNESLLTISWAKSFLRRMDLGK